MSDRNNRLWLYKFVLALRPAPLGVALKRLLGIKRQVLETENGTFLVDPCSEFGIVLLQDGEYEKDMVTAFNSFLTPNSVCVDVGANEGYFSVIASRLVGQGGVVVAVEPQSRVLPILEKNISLNHVSNIKLNQIVISNEKGTAEIYLEPDNNTGSSGLFRTTKYWVPKETIEMITLSELLDRNGLDVVHFMKMDIEGYEYEAILGSQDIFKSHIVKSLALELHPSILHRRGLDPDKITTFLRNSGYSVDARFSNLVFTVS